MAERSTLEGTAVQVVFHNEENGYTVLRLVSDTGELGVLYEAHPSPPAAPPPCHGGGLFSWRLAPHGESWRACESERGVSEETDHS